MAIRKRVINKKRVFSGVCSPFTRPSTISLTTKFSFKLLNKIINPDIILNAAIIGSFINIKLIEKIPIIYPVLNVVSDL